MFIITREKPQFFEKRIRDVIRDEVENGEAVVFTKNKAALYEWNKVGAKAILNPWLSRLPQGHVFAFGMIDTIADTTIIYKLNLLLKNGGHLFLPAYNEQIPYFIEQLEIKARDIKYVIEEEAKVKKHNDALKEEYKKELELWKKEKARIKVKNDALKEEYKATLKAFKELLKQTPKEVQKFMKEPEEPILEEVPKKPEKPILEEAPSRPSFLFDRTIERTLSWKIFSEYKIKEIKDGYSLFGYLLEKREETIKFSFKRIVEVVDEIEEISVDDLIEIKNKAIDNKAKIAEQIAHQYTQPIDIDIISDFLDEVMLSKNDYPLFSEEVEDNMNMTITPLTPVKPMHAASMLAGGIGEYSKEFVLDNEPYLIKAAIVKEYSTRTKRENGKEIEETIEHYEQKMGVYNLFKKELQILG